MRIFVIAGEPSGDRLGAALMAGFKTLLPATDIRFEGVGGPLMQAEGLQSLFPMDETTPETSAASPAPADEELRTDAVAPADGERGKAVPGRDEESATI